MIKSLIFLVIFFVLLSCNKENSISKKLDGIWTVNRIKVEDGEGFSYYDSSPDGTISFESELKKISSQVYYEFIGLQGFTIIDTFKLNQNNYIFNAKKDRIFINSGVDTINARIILLTKNSMELEYYDLLKYRLVRFVLSKD